MVIWIGLFVLCYVDIVVIYVLLHVENLLYLCRWVGHLSKV